MAAPTNISGATAIELGPLPNSITQNVRDGSTTYTVWYKYTATATEIVGIWAYGGLAAYEPILEVSTSSTGAPLYLDILSHNRPVQFPATQGTVYYLKVTTNSSAANPASLVIAGEAAPTTSVPEGSIFITDDTPGFPLALLSGTDGTVLRFVQPFPAGENAVILDDGRVLTHDDGDTDHFFFYDTDFISVLWALTLSIPVVGHPPMWTNGTDQFWIGVREAAGSTPARVFPVSLTGVEGTVIGPFVEIGLRGIAVNAAATILYYHGQGGFADSKIQRWDLGTNLALSDLVADNAGFYPALDLLCLAADGSVIVGYNADGGGTHYLKRYSAAGATLNTYTLGATEEINRLVFGVTQATFWVWLFPTDEEGVSRFQEIRISDGTVLKNFDAAQFEVGVFLPDETATPARFGHSFSCPFLITRAQAVVTTITYPVRRQRTFTIPNDENKKIFLKTLELELQRGVGLVQGQGDDPHVLFQLSRDGGQTWGPERRVAAGKLGEYMKRVIVRKLGTARNPVGRITVSDPVFWALCDAYLEATPGTS